MGRICAIPGCLSTDTNAVVHRFPKKNEQSQLWQQRLQLQHIPLPVLLQKYVVCTLHFDRKDYRNIESRKLNFTALPRAVETSSYVEIDGDCVVAEGDHDDDAIEMDAQLDDRLSLCQFEMDGDQMMGFLEHDDNDAGHQVEEQMAIHQAEPLELESSNFAEYISHAASAGSVHCEPNSTAEPILETSAEHHQQDAYLMPSAEHATDHVAESQFTHHDDIPSEITTDMTIEQSFDDISSSPATITHHPQHQLDNPVDFDHLSDQYVYVLEMNEPEAAENVVEAEQQLQQPESYQSQLVHIECNDELPPSSDFVNDASQVQHTQALYPDIVSITSIEKPLPVADDDDESTAISNLLSALTRSPTSGGAMRKPPIVDDDEEPYALHDTDEVRLYSQMSKRSLIQLLVAANGRCRDLEERVDAMEAVHAKVLGSLEMVRSVLKR